MSTTGSRGRIENLKPFKPGQSGNPSGRPKTPPELMTKVRGASEHCINKAIELVDNKNPMVALRAIELLLAYGYGKPRECVQMEIAEDIQIRTQIRSLLLEGKMERQNERAIEA